MCRRILILDGGVALINIHCVDIVWYYQIAYRSTGRTDTNTVSVQLEVGTQRMQAFIERKPTSTLSRFLWALLTLCLAGRWQASLQQREMFETEGK